MAKASQHARLEVGARSIELDSTTCLWSKRFWDPFFDGRQLCEPKTVPTGVINP